MSRKLSSSLGLFLLACASAPPEAPAPPATYFYPGMYGAPGANTPPGAGTPAPVESAAPANNTAPLPQTIGEALAPFGIIVPPAFNQAPPSPQQWAQIPWGNVPWPFLFGGTVPPPPPQGNPPPADQLPGAPPPAARPPAAPPAQPRPPQPTPPPAPAPGAPSRETAGWNPEELRLFELVNDLRVRGATCGSVVMPPVPPLKANAALGRAARSHSVDMAQHNYFGHEGRDGKKAADRAQAQGYGSAFVGENLATGKPTAERTMQQWMGSEGHCINMLSPEYADLGTGYAHSTTAQFHDYWAQVFGR